MSAAAPGGRRRDTLFAWVMGGPAFLGLLIFLLVPFMMAIGLSFTNQRLLSPNPTELIGFQNYRRLLDISILPLEPEVNEETGDLMRDEAGNLEYPRSRAFTRDEENYPQYAGFREWFYLDWGTTRYFVLAQDPTFYQSLVNNMLFAFFVVPLQSFIALLLALLINQKLAGINVFRTIFFSPVVTSMVVISVIWTFLYDEQVGMINSFLAVITFGAVDGINWLGNPAFAMPAIIIMSIWQGVGFQMVIFLAGLQGIPGELYEAAQIDGANRIQRFLNVTIPQLRNTIIFVAISTTILAFRLFTQVDVMTNGGPQDATTTVVYYAVERGFRENNIGYASAISVVFFVFVLFIALIQRQILPSEEQ